MSSASELLSDKRILVVWEKYRAGDKSAIDEIYPELISFCLRVASKTCNRYITMQDEEASIAQISIMEAFDKYDPARGTFCPFLGRVIRNRLIDYRRKENRLKIIPLSKLEDNEEGRYEIIADDFFTTIIDDMARQDEIKKFKKVLEEFQISFGDLIKVSPKQKGTREKAKQIAIQIMNHNEIRESLLEKKALPATKIKSIFNIDHKILDRYRKYIIAGVLILYYQFAYLKPYLFPSNKGDE